MFVRQDIVLGHLKNVAFNFTTLKDLLSAIEPETFGKVLLQKKPHGWVSLFQEQENQRWQESRKKHIWVYAPHQPCFICLTVAPLKHLTDIYAENIPYLWPLKIQF